MTAEHQFADIRDNYNNFFRPSVKILVDGQDLAEDLQCRIHSVAVNLCLGRPSTADFELTDCYDLEGHKVKNQLLSKLLPGSPVKISLGYGSSLSLLFSGYIDCAELTYSGDCGHLIRGRAADVCRLMQENGTRRRVLQVEKYSEAFTRVMKSYGGVCSAKAEETPEKLDQGLFQEESDYDFVGRMVRETGFGFEFLVEKGIAYFRKRDSGRKPVVELSLGHGMNRLELGLFCVNRSLEIQGYSPKQGLLTARKTAKAARLNSKFPQGTEVFQAPWATAQETVNSLAAAYSGCLTESERRGIISCVGMPILLPGNYVSLKDVDAALDGNFYMTRVEHALGDDGYITTVCLNDWSESPGFAVTT